MSRPRWNSPEARPCYSWCPACGKRAYPSKRDAKRANRRLYPNDRMNAYRCPHESPWDAVRWHLGHLQPGDRDPSELEHAS